MTKRLWLPLATALTFATAVNAGEELPRCGGHDMGKPSQPAKGQGHDHDRDGQRDEPPAPPPVAHPTTSLTIEVTEKGFVPAQLQVKVKEWLEVTLLRRTDKTCARRIIFDLGGGETIQHDLPLNQPVVFRTRFERAGMVPFACQMKMVTGSVLVR